MKIDHSRTWTNWVGNQTCAPARIEQAAHETQIADAVRRAAAEGHVIRTFGSGHSFTPIVSTDGVLLETDALRGIVDIDTSARTITAKAQTQIKNHSSIRWLKH